MMKKFKLTIINSILLITLVLISINTNSVKCFIKVLQFLTFINFIAALIFELYKNYMSPVGSENPIGIIDEAFKGVVNPDLSDSENKQN